MSALLDRVARLEGLSPRVETLNSRGGRGRALSELVAWQRAVKTGRLTGIPDLLVVVIDGNCHGYTATRSEVEAKLEPGLFPNVVIAIPDPHVERWLMADPVAFQGVVGVLPPPDPGKCERDLYKRLLRQTTDAADLLIVTDVLELAPDLVAAMDLYRAGKAQPALGHCVDELRLALRELKGT